MQTAHDRFQEEMSRIAAEEAERPRIRAAGIEALHRLLPVATQCSLS